MTIGSNDNDSDHDGSEGVSSTLAPCRECVRLVVPEGYTGWPDSAGHYHPELDSDDDGNAAEAIGAEAAEYLAGVLDVTSTRLEDGSLVIGMDARTAELVGTALLIAELDARHGGNRAPSPDVAVRLHALTQALAAPGRVRV